jgi:tRNA threonylcarbamoyladenosine biosynthesis protein TsaB
MWVCAIETSSRFGEVALREPGGTCHQLTFANELSHGRDLFPALRDLLSLVGRRPSDIKLLAVDCGPGSYTGLRIGVTAAKTLAFSLGTPVVPVNSLDVLARNAVDQGVRNVAPIIDAKMGQVYGAAFALDPPRRLLPDFVGPVEELLPLLPPDAVVFGDGVARYRAALSGFQAGPEPWGQPRAAAVAELGSQAFLAGGGVDAHALAPLYLRLSTAEQKLQRGSHAP